MRHLYTIGVNQETTWYDVKVRHGSGEIATYAVRTVDKESARILVVEAFKERVTLLGVIES